MPRKKRSAPGLGKRLKKLRKDRGLSQSQLARAVGTDQQTISAYERDIALPTLPIVVRLSGILKVSADEILGIKGTKTLPHMDGPTAHLWKKFQVLRSLPERDQRAFFRMLATVQKAIESTST